MIIYTKNSIVPVISMKKLDRVTIVFTGDNCSTYKNEEFNKNSYGNIELIKEIKYNEKNVKYYSEISDMSYEIFQKMVSDDFSSNEEKEKFNFEFKKVKKQIENAKKKIKKDFYILKIKNRELELWKNNFDDLVYEVGNNEYYIDDKEYDIFYKITKLGEYEFNFIEK